MFPLKTAKVIGTPNGTAWSQVHEFIVEGEKLEKRGQFLAILTLKEMGVGIEAVSAGREILARINEEYYGNLLGTPFERLKTTLEKLGEENENLELVVAVFYQKVGYFGILRGGKIVVKRGSVMQKALELMPDRKPANTEALNNAETLKLRIASGFVQGEDIFLLGSEKFFEVVAEGTWRAALGAGEPEEMVEILAPIVAGREKVGGAAVGIVKVESGKWKVESGTTEKRGRVEPELTDISLGVSQKTQRTASRLFPVLSVIKTLFGKIIRFRPKTIFIKRQADQQRRKKTLLSVAVVLIFLLLVSVVLGVRKRSSERKQSQLENLIGQVESKLEEGKGLGAIKPAEAKKVLQEAQQLFDQSSRFKVQGSRLKALREEIEAELAKVVKEYQFSEVPVFLDLSLVQEGAKGNDLALSGNNLVVLDKEGKRLLGIDLEKKSAKILAGGEDLEGASQVAIWDDKAYVLTQKGIIGASPQILNSKFQIPKDEKWGEIIDLVVYKGNLYLLDKREKMVWRYLVTETGFGARQNWLKGEGKLLKPVSLTIDGFVWILESEESGRLRKFASGIEELFSITGLERSLASPTRIYTDEQAKNLYILDKGNYRVVVLDKEGNYQASYLWVGIEDVEEMVVSEKLGKILLLAGSKIYEIEIKN